MKAYFDTSVVVALTLREHRWPVLSKWVESHTPVAHFNDFGWGECVSAIGLKVRRGEIQSAQASLIVWQIAEPLRSWIRIRTEPRQLDRAADMVGHFSLGLRFPDAIHIAMALDHHCVLVSADQRQIAAAQYFGCEAINPYDAAG